ncbi:MAG: TIGR01212 family radical SAM protein [Candidatus Aminicenantes bacterium]|nr:TIGR01212 family radical SAM protein [Candidatus Aminicenantes bacterium]
MNTYPDGLRYRKFSSHLKRTLGCRVYKISLDAGLSCPNRDGTFSTQGCFFCDPSGGSGRKTGTQPRSLSEQITSGIIGLKKKYKADKFIAYFQTFTNTYAPHDTLKQLYQQAVQHPDVIGLSIATRPDCLNEANLNLIESHSKNLYTWIELGIQSIHKKSLEYMNRGHGLFETVDALLALKDRSIHVCAHFILGLPEESLEDMAETARVTSRLGIQAAKLHMLYVAQNTSLAKQYKKGTVSLLSKKQYIRAAVNFLEHLSPDVIIQRLVSEAHPDLLIAPEWLKDKSQVIQEIEQELEVQKTWQGKKFHSLLKS